MSLNISDNFENTENVFFDSSGTFKKLSDLSETDAKEHIKLVWDKVKSSKDAKDSREELVELFTHYSSHKNLKKHLLATLRTSNRKELSNIICDILNDVFNEIKTTKKCEIRYNKHFIYFVESCLSDCSFRDSENVFIFHKLFSYCNFLIDVFYKTVLSMGLQQKALCEEITEIIDSVTKLLLLLLTNSNVSFISFELCVTLLNIINSNYVDFDVRKKCGLILLYFYIKSSDDEKMKLQTELKISNISKEYTLDMFVNKLLELQSVENLHTRVVLYTSLYNVSEPLKSDFDKKIKLIIFVTSTLLDDSLRVTNISELIVEISRVLCSITMSTSFQKVSSEDFSFIFGKSIMYVWNFVEHYVPFVRQYTKDFLNNIIKIASKFNDNGDPQFLDSFVSRIIDTKKIGVIYFNSVEILSMHAGSDYVLNRVQNVHKVLEDYLFDSALSLYAINAYKTMMENNINSLDLANWINLWLHPVVLLLRSPKVSSISESLENIIYNACKASPEVVKYLFSSQNMEHSKDESTFLKCLLYARNNLPEIRDKDDETLWKGLIKKSQLNTFAYNQNDSVRISVISVIVDSNRTTELYTNYDFDYILEYLKFNISSEVPSTRKQIIAALKRGFTRFSASYCVITREIRNLKKTLQYHASPALNENLDLYLQREMSYRNFITTLIKDLASNLIPGSCYYRRAASLELLLAVQPHVTKNEWSTCWSPMEIQNLMNCLCDSFESNKKMALELLQSFSAEELGFTNEEETSIYFSHCCKMAFDIKPASILSASYMIILLTRSSFIPSIKPISPFSATTKDERECTIEYFINKLSLTLKESTDVYDAAKTKPLHGTLLCLFNLIKTRNRQKEKEFYKKTFAEILKQTVLIRDIIIPIVCNPSPEGYLPDQDLSGDIDQSSESQMVLVYAWRTMKELTLLLAEIVVQSCENKNEKLLPIEDVYFVVDTFFTIFIQAKHRGAFEQASVGFSMICNSFWWSDDEYIKSLPFKWLGIAIDYCVGKKSHPMLSQTRRSCGLPFLLISIVTSHPRIKSSKILNHVMTPLLDTAKDSTCETKMHCLNTLRAIFRNTKLGEHVIPYVGNAMVVAISGYNSELWGVRNSATLLYSSLMLRIFGVQRTQDLDDVTTKNKLSVKVFKSRFPNLLEFLLETLTNECENCIKTSLLLHPILLILSRIFPSSDEEFDEKMEKHFNSISKCLSHPVYKTRELAARTSITFIKSEKFSDLIKSHFDLLSCQRLDGNSSSGILLQLLQIVKHSEIKNVQVISEAINKSNCILNKNLCTSSLYMKVARKLLLKCDHFNDINILNGILSALKNNKDKENITSKVTCRQNRILLILTIVLKKLEHFATLDNAAKCEIESYLKGQDTDTIKFCLKILLYLNKKINTTRVNHSLLIFEDLEIPSNIRETIDAANSKILFTMALSLHPCIKNFCDRYNFNFSRDILVEFLLILRYYPCLLKSTFLDNEASTVRLIEFIKEDNDEITSASLSCFGILLNENFCYLFEKIKFEELLDVLCKGTSPEAPEHLRLTVCEVIGCVASHVNFSSVIEGDHYLKFTRIFLTLLEDDEVIIRNSISKVVVSVYSQSRNIVGCDSIPEKARLLYFEHFLLPSFGKEAVKFLLDWCLQPFTKPSNSLSEVFESSDLNQYSDKATRIKSVLYYLHKTYEREKEEQPQLRKADFILKLFNNKPLKTKNIALDILLLKTRELADGKEENLHEFEKTFMNTKKNVDDFENEDICSVYLLLKGFFYSPFVNF